MKTYLRLITLASLSLLLQACEVSVDDGRVPPEYLTEAQGYAGTYLGEFDGRPGTLALSVREDGYVEVATPGFEGGDIYDVGCGSKIGPLLRIAGNQPKDKSQAPILERLVLGFHRSAMACIASDEIVFNFGKNKQGRIDINASLVLFLTSHGQPYTIYGYFVKE